jgi:hypothetical protein
MTTKMIKIKKPHTTVGELIAALTDAARAVTVSERDAYRLTDFVFNRMLRPVPVTATYRRRVPMRTKKNRLPC